MSQDNNKPLALELKGIDKRFGTVHANRGIDLQVEKGTIHGIVGENGAGKSTLMSIIYGFYQADAGEMFIDGQPLIAKDSKAAIDAGIGMVHQHFMLVHNFTVLENVILGAESSPLLNRSMSDARATLKQLEKDYNLQVPLDTQIQDLPVGIQQRVEILKALYRGAKVLILDEPTGVLTPQETDHLFKILAALRDQGTTVIIITHKLREILAVTDNVSVMRQGAMVAHLKTKETSREELAEQMVGRKVLLRVKKGESTPSQERLRVEQLNYTDKHGVPRLKNLNFSVRAGEIVGIAGVSGNGQSELLEVLAGMKALTSGRFAFGDTWITHEAPLNAEQIRHLKVAHVPEDRQAQGLVTAFPASEAFILGYHRDPQYNHKVLMKQKDIVADCAKQMKKWDVRPPIPDLKTANFSGGNQQKLVLAREVERDPDVMLIGQPTRGVDIGAIEFIHQEIIRLRDHGKAILLVSVELDEIFSLTDRILVLFDGQIVAEVNTADADERMLGLMMANAHEEEVAHG
ncbi:ABC transporter ATP-binding protein [Salinispirillum marinum]|uniref:ABC transporter ATP-binding protein n=2 Tax=Saccharospirillaceae TaxID=255527 RepID=A0ABV8BES6_9GAMM